MPISDSTATQHLHRSNSRHRLRAKLHRGMQTRGTASRESLQMRPQYGPIFYAISTVIWLNFAGTPLVQSAVPITKCKPSRRGRKTLNLDYKPRRISFSQLSEVGRDSVTFRWWEQKRGSESEEARNEWELAAGKISLAPILEQAPKDCSSCGNSIPGEAKRHQILSVEQPSVGLAVNTIEWLEVQCEKCHGAETVRSDSEPSAQDESWMEKLTADERFAYSLSERNMNQTQIAEKMGKSQQTVSRLLSRIEGKRKAAQLQKLQATGGA